LLLFVIRRLTFVLLVYFSQRPPQFWLLGLEFLVLLLKFLLQYPLAPLGLTVLVAFIVITVTEMDMTRIIVTRRSDRLSFAEVGVPYRLSLSILIYSGRYSCYFADLLSLHLLELLVLSLLVLLALSLRP
jgi:hypothetical protein